MTREPGFHGTQGTAFLVATAQSLVAVVIIMAIAVNLDPILAAIQRVWP